MNTENLEKFSAILQIEFHNLELLKEALTHRSAINEDGSGRATHNERLEFLGDAVLELVTTEFLFEKYPTRTEGDLTSFRAALVRTESLAEVAERLGYGQYLYMSKGEETTGGRTRPYILANSFEAVIGAIYLDQGMDACKIFIARELLPKIEQIVSQRLDIDPKSKLQELAQDTMRITPSYRLVEAIGPDHDKTFVMAVWIGEKEFGRGQGHSKQDAEQQAAGLALRNWAKLYENNQKSGKISPAA